MKNILWGRKMLSLAAALLLLLSLVSLATAKTTMKDVAKLKQDIAAIDGDVAASHADTIVADRIAKEFKVSPSEVTALSGRLPGLGETAAVYALADRLKGGVTDSNISTVMSKYEAAKDDWGAISRDLNISLSSVAGKVKSIEKGVHKDIKKASTGKGTTGTAGGGVQKRDFSDEHYQ